MHLVLDVDVIPVREPADGADDIYKIKVVRKMLIEGSGDARQAWRQACGIAGVDDVVHVRTSLGVSSDLRNRDRGDFGRVPLWRGGIDQCR